MGLSLSSLFARPHELLCSVMFCHLMSWNQCQYHTSTSFCRNWCWNHLKLQAFPWSFWCSVMPCPTWRWRKTKTSRSSQLPLQALHGPANHSKAPSTENSWERKSPSPAFSFKKTVRIYYFNFTQLQHKTIAKEKWKDVKWLALRNEPYERCSCKYVSLCIIVYYDLNWCYLLSFPPAVIRRLTFLVEIGIALIAPLPGKFCTCRRRWLLICQLKMATWPSVAVATKTSDKVDTKVTVRSRMLPTAVEATWSDGKCLRQAPKQFSIVF